MQITFLRIDERRCASTALRDDGVTVRVPGYGRTVPLPHDLAHYVVEHELGLRDSLWRRIAAGGVFPGMRVIAGRRKPHAEERSRAVLKANSERMTRAEVLVGVLMEIVRTGLDRHRDAALARLADAWSPAVPDPVQIGFSDVMRVCAALREAATQWAGVEASGSLTVTWSLPAAEHVASAPSRHHRGRPAAHRLTGPALRAR